MKTRAINIAELILLLLFIACAVLHAFHIPFVSWGIIIFGSLLACLYWPLGFYTLALPNVSKGYSMAAGLLFCLSITQVMFFLLRWPANTIILYAINGIYLILALVAFCFYFFDKQNGKPIQFDKALLIRFAVYFLFALYALFSSKSF